MFTMKTKNIPGPQIPQIQFYPTSGYPINGFWCTLCLERMGQRQIIFEINVPHTYTQTDIPTDRHTAYPKILIPSH